MATNSTFHEVRYQPMTVNVTSYISRIDINTAATHTIGWAPTTLRTVRDIRI